MSSPDPLELLLKSIAASEPIVLLTAASEPTQSLPSATYISFLDPSAPDSPILIAKDAPTRYTSRSDSRTDLYTVGQLWLAWTERETGVREYLMKGQEAGGGGYVGIADRRAVIDYLEGKSEGGGRVVSKREANVSDGLTGAAAATAESGEAGPSKTQPAKRKYEVDVEDREFCKKLRAQEIELRDRNSILRSSNGGKINDFTPFLKTVMSEKIRALRQSMSSGGDRSAQQPVQVAYGMSSWTPRLRIDKAKSSHPIIVISSSPTALITMWNVRKFLEQGVFEPSETARQAEAEKKNFKAEDMIPIIRKRTGPSGDISQKYYIVDGVEALQKFGQDAWDRVVCVVTTGQAWQFKMYKWQDPKTLFRHVKGFYFQWNNEQSNPAVKDWNITEMRIDRLKRHTDRQVVADFWRTLDGAKRR
ncbi:RNA pol II accessory factor, Cdc73 family-domain-containing protein [Dioszegia hungarica]|uniref:RNA pol II accessory factor, Cdc73 family-domain-containing protein n=1 Tax=Dioszegia hungarica TaxID=4972 RepID=A0AA38H550_9TREE|nr:RNA pol II accessory factor, Cdc73 family-domain-containing protein [Dioszegia hungarica]KAI9633056.1 RNA pol II accessory factor, Cdc73 family-domain-containing protein [Dioszegia hungarica]